MEALLVRVYIYTHIKKFPISLGNPVFKALL